ncbi:MAG: mechanosensitive ion channel [Bacteroidales bacterium]|nr:mechanosensitive ion channel [Bacteroidales bacterium]
MFILLEDTIPALASPDSLAAKSAEVKDAILNTPAQELISSLGQQAIHFGLKVLAALAIYLVGAWVIRLIRKAVRKGFQRRKTESTLSSFVDSLVSIALWVLLIILVVGTLGVNTASLAALLAAGGMAIGMALSGTVQNFAGGIMLLVFKPFKVGDFIEAQGYSGTVQALTIASTHILTTDNRLIVIPNGALSNGNIANITGKELRRVDIEVNVGYGNDAEKVKNALLEIVKANPLFLDAATKGAADPFAALIELGESTVRFVVRAWVKSEDYWTARFALQEAIYTELPAQFKVKFAFPQVDVHVKNA